MGERTCAIDGCDQPRHARGWCPKHYQRWRKTGDPTDHGAFIVNDDEARWLSYVDRNGPTPGHRPDLGPCWVWTGNLSDWGYGRFCTPAKETTAHRWGYEHFVGPIPDGLEPDHLCHNRACVNYERHLEPVTHRENLLRRRKSAA